MQKIKVGIFGSSGMVGGEIIRWLSNHPYVEKFNLFSEHSADEEPYNVHGFLSGNSLPSFIRFNPLKAKECDVLFFTNPQSYTSGILKQLEENKTQKIIDLAQGFRIKEVKNYEKWFNDVHLYPEIVDNFVYGLTEIFGKKIKNAKYIANPGCYPTAVLLSLYPLAKEYIRKDTCISINAFSGLTGAGNKLSEQLSFINNYNSIRPYKVGYHQHTIEIENYLNVFNKKNNIKTLFIPHTFPVNRGILSISTIKNLTVENLFEIYSKTYNGNDFIRIYDRPEKINVNNVIHTNFCHIAPYYDKRTDCTIIYSIIDNLVKGAAGQAIQNMNLMMDYPENCGLL